MILILSDGADAHADFLVEKLRLQGLPYYRLNLDVESLRATTVTYRDGEWTVAQSAHTVHSSEFTAVWARRGLVQTPLGNGKDANVDFKIFKGEWNKALVGLYSSLSRIAWLNWIGHSIRSENKYLQMKVASSAGLRVPDTIVSNDRHELLSFAALYGDVALKLMTQEIYEVEPGKFKGFYVNKLTCRELSGFREDGENPITLQQYIPKAYEVRYTIVGDEHLACRIESQNSEIARTDWRRYDLPNTPHSSMNPPAAIVHKTTRLMAELGLEYGALDFIVTPSDDWYFLEVNPNGQWLWIEQLTGLDISGAITRWLRRAMKGDSR